MLNSKEKQILNEILFDFPNIHAADFGFKEKNGKKTDQFAIRFKTKKKGFWPAVFNKRVPKSFYGYQTDVLECSEPQPRSIDVYSPDQRVILEDTPLQHRVYDGYLHAGISISGEKYSGSLGPIVYDNTNKCWAALTASHLFIHGSSFEVVQHPAMIETTDNFKQIGNMIMSMKELYVDSALVHFSHPAARRIKFYPKGYNYNLELKKFGRVSIGDVVYKAGRTTGNQAGVVTSYGLMGGTVDGHFYIQEAFYVDDNDGQYANLFSSYGDSGCVVFNDKGEIVGVNTSTIVKQGRQQAGVNPIDTIQYAYAQKGIDIQPDNPLNIIRQERKQSLKQNTGYTTGYTNPFSNNK